MLVGLTGGIGSGKSTVSKMFLARGAHVVDADVLARVVVEPGRPALQELVSQFGTEILAEDGTLDRGKLGQLVFGNHEKLAILNGIVHPRVREEMIKAIAEATAQDPRGIVILDVPLLIEGGMYKMVEKCIVVFVDPDVQLARLMQRDGTTEEEALRRIRSQMPLAEKKQYADFVIDNNGTMETTELQVDEIWEKLRLLSGAQ